MDISDKNFKPCPCGYQICQFCYNNIRQNPELNGRCPGCRRLYDDESVEYKTLTSEEYKMQQFKKEKRDREKKQREKEKKELEIASKKHLAGLRVVQKNLVYVTGLNPPCPSEDLHSVLRSDKYFGQYGKILKIVINRKAPNGHQNSNLSLSIVVYVTFTRKEDALRCISELDGSLCDGRVLRAAHGTTKYCLSYLRGHPCPNPNCMFLHEPGEEADSYTRKDLSTHQGIKMGMSGLLNEGNSSLSQCHYSDEDNATDEEKNASSTPVVPNSAHPLNGSGGLGMTPLIHGTASLMSGSAPVLPATAHWAKALNTPDSANVSPSVNSPVLTNAAAFPTLGEISKDQKSQKKESKKSKGKASKEGTYLPDDIDIDDNSVLQFIDNSAERLKALTESNQSLKVYFDDLSEEGSVTPLFHFDGTIDSSTTPSLESEKVLAIHVIERCLLRPMKKYHLAYLNQPFGPQQQFLQQVQMQSQQQQVIRNQSNGQGLSPASTVPLPDYRMLQLSQQQSDPTIHPKFPPHFQGKGANTNPLVAGVPAAQPLSQFQALRASEGGRTSTPPPPGLFGKAHDASSVQSAQAQLSSSSQLLNQLMSGKK